MWTFVQEVLFCPVHGVLRWWPLLMPIMVGGVACLRRFMARL
jgi:hypothetical protein